MGTEAVFPGRVGLQQRVLPDYRAAFFDRLAGACSGGLSVFAGQPRRGEAIQPAQVLNRAQHTPGRNLHLLSGRAALLVQPGILSWLRAWDPDALILEANPRYLSNRAALAWMHDMGRPVIGWGLGAPAPAGPLAGLVRWARRGFLRRFQALIAYSSLGAEQYRAAGFPPGRVFLAPNAVGPPPADAPPRPPASGRPLRLLFVGRLQSRKRVDRLLQACALLDPAPELWVIGDGPARAALEQLARQAFPRARFHGDLRGPSLAAAFEQADLFVLPGTGGLAVQEAMAHGLPVIVGEGDGTQHDLVSEANGWLVPGGDLAGLAQALRQALADPARLAAMGAASRRLVREHYNIDAMTAVFVRALNDVVARGA